MPRAPRPPSQALVCVSSPSTVTDEWALVGARTCRHQLPGDGICVFSLSRGGRGSPGGSLPPPRGASSARPPGGPAPPGPPAMLAAKAARLRAALRSRSRTRPHASHRNTRVRNGSLAFTTPQPEQVLLEGSQRSASTSCPPFHALL